MILFEWYSAYPSRILKSSDSLALLFSFSGDFEFPKEIFCEDMVHFQLLIGDSLGNIAVNSVDLPVFFSLLAAKYL